MSKKSESLALKKRVLDSEKTFFEKVRARMKDLSKDKELEKRTIKDLQRRFK